jgi:hypothetical protein
MVKEQKGYWYFAPVLFLTLVAATVVLHNVFTDDENSVRHAAPTIQDPHYTAPIGNTMSFVENAAKMNTPLPIPAVRYVCLDSAVAHEPYNVVDSYDTTKEELGLTIAVPAR